MSLTLESSPALLGPFGKEWTTILMLPLDAIKVPQGKKTLELGQSRSANGKGRDGEAAPWRGL